MTGMDDLDLRLVQGRLLAVTSPAIYEAMLQHPAVRQLLGEHAWLDGQLRCLAMQMALGGSIELSASAQRICGTPRNVAELIAELQFRAELGPDAGQRPITPEDRRQAVRNVEPDENGNRAARRAAAARQVQ